MPKKKDRGFSIVQFYWNEPDRAPMMSMSNDDLGSVWEGPLLAPPQVLETVTLWLPIYTQAEPVVFPQIPVQVTGQVPRVETNQAAGDTIYAVYLKRIGRTGLRWDELGACIGAPMVGFHPDLGRIEGTLFGLLPPAELAGMHVPSLRPIYERVMRQAGAADEMVDGPPVVWVAWSSIWTAEGLEHMRQRATKKR